MQPVLQALLHLQEVDRDVFRVQTELKRLPAERAARRAEVDRKLGRLAELRNEAKKVRVRIKEIEDATTVARQRVRKVENEAANSRQDMALLVAYQHEIRTLKRDIGSSEEEGLQLVENVETLEAQAAALHAEIEGEERLYSEFSGNVEREIAEAQSRLAALVADRERRRASGAIPVEPLALYQRLLQAREGVAMAQLDGRICQMCFIEMPTNLVVRVARGVEVVQCPSCDRILYPAG